MDVTLLNKSFRVYREVFHQTRIIQESTESVVPDTDEDIGRIASMESSVFLKSKDVTARGVTVTAEVSAAAICINENGDRAGFVRLSRQFAFEYDVPGIDPDTAARIELNIIGTDVRMVNSRKVSACFDISAELSCYMPENVETDYSLPEDSRGVYVKRQQTELILPNAVCEKTCAVTEQFSFPSGKPAPSVIISGCTRLNVTDSQLVGSRVILKGRAEIHLLYLSEGTQYPLEADFSAPFSQLIDIGEESMESCSVRPELTNAYYDLIDSVTGEKALSAEIHGVIQLVSRTKLSIGYISDLYSNSMPADITMSRAEYSVVSAITEEKINADERVRVSDDCEDVLWVGMSIGRISQAEGRICTAVFADIMYRDREGRITSVRRSVEAACEMSYPEEKLTDWLISDLYLRPDGEYIDIRASVLVRGIVNESTDIMRVTAFSLDEDSPYDPSEFPGVTMVRHEGESLWELAKTYHSSVELIRQYNDPETLTGDKMLLIARAM